MPRHNKSSDVFIDGACKIRKRGCSSSSSASSVLQNYKFKKAILIPRRNVGSPPSSKKASFFESSPNQPLNIVGIGAQQGSVSARKLASALWETNKIPSSHRIVDIPGKISKKEIKGRGRIVKSVLPDYLPPHLSDPSHSPVSVVSIGCIFNMNFINVSMSMLALSFSFCWWYCRFQVDQDPVVLGKWCW